MGAIAILCGTVVAALATVVSAVVAARSATRAAAETREAQRIAVAPAEAASNLAILEATVKRVDQENAETRVELRGLRALVRAYSWTVDRLMTRMTEARVPLADDDIHPTVREHMTTGA